MFDENFVIAATVRDESTPALRYAPTGTSLLMQSFTQSCQSASSSSKYSSSLL